MAAVGTVSRYVQKPESALSLIFFGCQMLFNTIDAGERVWIQNSGNYYKDYNIITRLSVPLSSHKNFLRQTVRRTLVVILLLHDQMTNTAHLITFFKHSIRNKGFVSTAAIMNSHLLSFSALPTSYLTVQGRIHGDII